MLHFLHSTNLMIQHLLVMCILPHKTTGFIDFFIAQNR